jgi:hypothetical protein
MQWMAWSALLAVVAGCDAASSARESSPRTAAKPSVESTASEQPAVEQAAALATVADQQVQPAAALAPAKGGGGATPPAAAAAEVKLPDPDASGYIETTFDDLKFEMTKTELFDRAMLTPKVNALMDKKIRVRGYIFPTLRKTGLNRIVLVRDNMECCFGPGAALFDCVLVTMAPGKTAEYSIRPVAVEGTIRLEELQGGPDGRPLAIYQMVGDKVE